MIYIYDLDGTVIDSSHRYKANTEGTVDLAHWRANCTRSQIMLDKLLPLADHWRESVKRGHTIIVSTARVMQSADYEYLRKNNLFAHVILSRETAEDIRPGYQQKMEQLSSEISDFSSAVMFEDCEIIRKHLQETLGLKCLHPDDSA